MISSPIASQESRNDDMVKVALCFLKQLRRKLADMIDITTQTPRPFILKGVPFAGSL